MELLKEFKPALIFLAKFLAIYFIGNILYGVYVESYDHAPDDVTEWVTAQTSWLLDKTGYSSSHQNVVGMPKVAMKEGDDIVLHVFEGCNGLNVMIVFVAFLLAFGGPAKWLAVFLPLGVVVIHLFNLLRIGLLYHLALNNSAQFHYYHKYFFTATLYLVVFGLWTVWVIRLNEKRRVKTAA
ncbi:MAG: exosortase family protein XrtF [Cyclobacteriaceae bacterium]